MKNKKVLIIIPIVLVVILIASFIGILLYNLSPVDRDNEKQVEFIVENGWGKTTLSNFIMAMLYGFNGNGRSINTNLRKKYTPWNNGVYGGSLEFKHNNKEYLIQRTFGSQSKDDQFVLYDLATNKVSNDYTSNIGFEILGLDYDSFERSIYIPQKDLDLGFNEDLKSKLANIIGGTNDVQIFEKAIEIVSTKYKEIKKSKSAGKLIDTKVKLEELEKNGLLIAGALPNGRLVEIVELPEAVHPWFVGVQFHPELKSRPTNPHPLFRDFIAAALKEQK